MPVLNARIPPSSSPHMELNEIISWDLSYFTVGNCETSHSRRYSFSSYISRKLYHLVSHFPSPLLAKSMLPPLSDNLNHLVAEVWNILPPLIFINPWLPSHTLSSTSSSQVSWNALSLHTTAATSLVHIVTISHTLCNQ